MTSLGIDIGSRTIKAVLLVDGEIREWEVVDATSQPAMTARSLLERYKSIPVVTTGYGRSLLEIEDIPSVTEIKACARGIRHCTQGARAVIDIGGQDLKVILLDADGRIAKFEMNDRCAAGTGKFLEIMAEKLGFELREFGDAAQKGAPGISISSVCTVFAESEVIGLLNKGIQRHDIALAVHQSVVGKLCGMYKRVCSQCSSVHLVGGGALNPCIKNLLESVLHIEVLVPTKPRITVALGAAVLAANGAD
ncbi:MAG: 3-hydroxyacyl-ACP dehydratase [Chitinivibrionales bacterium]|nr:3-hydroxyacyl-ACP dehydratase [Chitinivibrionales bacterium]MBD3356451.1 3-hydroxyacyl-ACP dehydratase [Chitinivibrionales bacterium]